MDDVQMEHCVDIINQFEPVPENSKNGWLGIDGECHLSFWFILCLIPRTTVTSLSEPKDTRCKTYPLCINPGVPL